jgi:hypothetical protein
MQCQLWATEIDPYIVRSDISAPAGGARRSCVVRLRPKTFQRALEFLDEALKMSVGDALERCSSGLGASFVTFSGAAYIPREAVPEPNSGLPTAR